MPFFVSIPLPGPFGWATRIGGRKSGPNPDQVVRAAKVLTGAQGAAAGLGELLDRKTAEIDARIERIRADGEARAAHIAASDIAASDTRIERIRADGARIERIRADGAARRAEQQATVQSWSARQDANCEQVQARLDGWFDRQQAKIDARNAARWGRRGG